MKKLFIVFLCFITVLALSGCFFDKEGTIIFIDDNPSIDVKSVDLYRTDNREVISTKTFLSGSTECTFKAKPGWYKLNIYSTSNVRFYTPNFYLSSGEKKTWYFSNGEIK